MQNRANTASRKPIDIKISTVVAVSAILRTTDPTVLATALAEMTGGVADFFDNEFAVIDLGQLDGDAAQIDWARLIALFRAHQLNPVAVRNAPSSLHPQILAQGLSLDAAPPARQETAPPEPVPASAPAPIQAAPAAAPLGTVIVDTPVRAGQRVYARGADLVITAAVNNGAEVIADGSIHVYAPLRGRALAGASGNDQARIFTLCMEAELVSIAGIYRTFEHGVENGLRQQAVQVRSAGNRIDILPIAAAGRV